LREASEVLPVLAAQRREEAKMVAKVRALICLLAVFLPLVVKGGGPEPFSVHVIVHSRQARTLTTPRLYAIIDLVYDI